MKLKTVYFRDAVRLPSGGSRTSISTMNPEMAHYDLFRIDRDIFITDRKSNQTIFVPMENVISAEPVIASDAPVETPEASDPTPLPKRLGRPRKNPSPQADAA